MNTARLGAMLALLTGPAAFTGAAPPPPQPVQVRSLAYAPDGTVLVAATGGGTGGAGGVVAWDAATRKQLWARSGPKGFGSVSFAPDGKSIAVTHGAATVLRLAALTGQEMGEVGPHPKPVRACVYVPGTGHLATGSDGTVRFWDLATGKVVKELKGGHPAEINSLTVSPNGKWLISGGPDGTRGWDVATGAELKNGFKQERGIAWYGPTFVGPDRVLFADNSATQYLLELPSGRELLRYEGFGGGIAYSPALGVAAFHWDGTNVHIMDLAFRAPTAAEQARIESLLKEFDDDSYPVRVAASKAMRQVSSVAEPALRKAMTDGPSAEVRMRARVTRKAILEEPLRTLKGHTARVRPMCFSPNGKVLATGAEDGTVRLWDPSTGKELARLTAPDPGVQQ
ncbi:WD domain, G-beta repeat [Gemmata obscuriglobus]|uniref:WD40 repeat domain-containing protein n=1 Tax=Gemmata obscuriglobus TaxID=114 RepID=A0A2Z3H5I8_9BACT|nr:WD40 repeat domain-containing protein [Gemmata obscuriglobus]AWM36884.1 WD40 repeat domain-containing protein [Gemmata obscuriglobus]QEG30443.1 WD domain, G-beta repeat [Gemmata obscuriglobus]VTS09767.1 ntpase-like protein : WD-40 repeat protein OS=Arthrospira maxima CS-328 GN=AmaxDRAFT_0527 PE=4 SV=1: PQQ_2: WD40 [Gemmata obscuriglobus UQM 2246]